MRGASRFSFAILAALAGCGGSPSSEPEGGAAAIAPGAGFSGPSGGQDLPQVLSSLDGGLIFAESDSFSGGCSVELRLRGGPLAAGTAFDLRAGSGSTLEVRELATGAAWLSASGTARVVADGHDRFVVRFDDVRIAPSGSPATGAAAMKGEIRVARPSIMPAGNFGDLVATERGGFNGDLDRGGVGFGLAKAGNALTLSLPGGGYGPNDPESADDPIRIEATLPSLEAGATASLGPSSGNVAELHNGTRRWTAASGDLVLESADNPALVRLRRVRFVPVPGTGAEGSPVVDAFLHAFLRPAMRRSPLALLGLALPGGGDASPRKNVARAPAPDSGRTEAAFSMARSTWTFPAPESPEAKRIEGKPA